MRRRGLIAASPFGSRIFRRPVASATGRLSCAGAILRVMATFLLKTEPDDYRYADLQRDGRTVWDGVANATACLHMRAAKAGDAALIYETGGHKRVTGLARLVSEPYADPERPDLTKAGEIKFVVFDLEPVAEATKDGATLAAIKADPRFGGFELVTQSRLSAMPVPATLDRALRAMAGLPSR